MAIGDVRQALGQATSAIADVAVAVTWQTPGDEVLEVCAALARLRSTLEAAYLSTVAEVDRRRSASPGSTASPAGSSTEGFLRTAATLSAGQARRDVAAARALFGAADGGPTDGLAQQVPAPLPEVAQQLAAGEVTREHVDVAVRCLDRVPLHLLDTEQQRRAVTEAVAGFVADIGPRGSPYDLDRGCRALLTRLDPDGSERLDPNALDRRFLDLSTDSTGMVCGAFQLDAVAGMALRTAIDALGAPSPADESGTADRRTPRQRRADALAQMAETALGVSVPRRGERPRIVVHVTPAQLRAVPGPATGQASGAADTAVAGDADVSPDRPTGRRVDGAGRPGDLLDAPPWFEAGQQVPDRWTVRRLSCDAVLQRVVQQQSAGPLDVGRDERLATVAQRRALAARDRGCVVPGCGAQPDWCDAHHIVHWADGGPTDLQNLALLCPGHHTAVHLGRWRVQLGPDGLPEVVPPPWLDPGGRTRRLPHHDVARLLGGLVS